MRKSLRIILMLYYVHTFLIYERVLICKTKHIVIIRIYVIYLFYSDVLSTES